MMISSAHVLDQYFVCCTWFLYYEVTCVSVCVLLAEALLGITKTKRSYTIWNHLTETSYL